jgi:hypothetical protein
MNSENEFEFDGKTYVAVVDDQGVYGCDQCVFKDINCDAFPPCFSGCRTDGLPVHFEEKQ